MKGNNLVIKRIILICFSVFVILFIIKCIKSDNSKILFNKNIVMKINNSELTIKDLNRMTPNNDIFSCTDEQINQFITQWMYTELLYQAALEHNFDKDERVKQKLEETKKQIIADSYLQAELEKNVKVDEIEIKAYYENNKNEFIRKETEVVLNQILVTKKEDADMIMNLLKKGTSFKDLAKKFSKAPSAEYGGYLGVYKISELKTVFRNVVNNLKEKSYSKPIKTEIGYHILYLEKKYKAGTIKSYNDVRNIILTAIRKKKESDYYEELCRKLEKKSKIYSNLDLLFKSK